MTGDLFSSGTKFSDDAEQESPSEKNLYEPLASRLRPRSLSDYIGQEHLTGEGMPLRRMAESGHVSSMILWGPPGTGKTTLAKILTNRVNAKSIVISAVTAGIADIREAAKEAEFNRDRGRSTVLFVDEVHRFNKTQQDAFLPLIENGTVIFIGATTENPSFALNSALLSRCRVFVLKSLSEESLLRLIGRAVTSPEGLLAENISFEEGVDRSLVSFAAGDARRLLNALEILSSMVIADEKGRKVITKAMLAEFVGVRSARFDNGGDRYYDLISAFHKSVRGSDPDAALYWFARIVTAGGDPLYVARRLIAIASEDVGTADPNGLRIAAAAFDCFTKVGPEEGLRAIAEAAVYLATAPKSNAVYRAWNEALRRAKEDRDYDVPIYLRNAPTKLMKDLGFKETYRYAHDEPGAYAAGECYFPEEMRGTRFYEPSDRGFEKKISAKLEYLRERDRISPVRRVNGVLEPNDAGGEAPGGSGDGAS